MLFWVSPAAARPTWRSRSVSQPSRPATATTHHRHRPGRQHRRRLPRRHLRAEDQTYTGPRLLVIDDVGLTPLDRGAGNAFFQVLNRRYGNHSSTIVTTNRSLPGWGELFGDPVLAAAILDRLLLHRGVQHQRPVLAATGTPRTGQQPASDSTPHLYCSADNAGARPVVRSGSAHRHDRSTHLHPSPLLYGRAPP